MRVKLEHTGGTIANTKIFDVNGEPISGIQKAVIEFDAKDSIPKVHLTVINFDATIEADATLSIINYGGYKTNPEGKSIEEMSSEEVKAVIKHEAVQHWAKSRDLMNALKEIEVLREKVKILEGK